MYKLIQTAPEEHEQNFATVVGAALGAMKRLREDDVATHVEAGWFATHLSECELGVEVTHLASGYAFRIEHVEASANASQADLRAQLMALDAQYEQATGSCAFLYADGAGPGAYHFTGGRVMYGVRSALAHMKDLLRQAAEEMEESA